MCVDFFPQTLQLQRFTVKTMKIAFVSFLMNAIYGLDDLNDSLHIA